MLIRKAEERDMDGLIELCALHANYERNKYDPAGKKESLFNHLFFGSKDLQCLIVECQGKLLGYATYIKQFSTWDAEYYVYLDCLYLKEEIRGKGVGRKLMKLIKDYSRKEGCNHIQWQTPNFNEKAITFYNRLGAVSRKKERFFWY